MRIVDTTANAPVADLAWTADTWWSRFRGLMLAKELEAGQALRIEPCASIHMMFMRFPIDAVFYKEDGTVTKVSRNVRPWMGFAFGGKGAKGVLELPVGAAQSVEPGHVLKFAA